MICIVIEPSQALFSIVVGNTRSKVRLSLGKSEEVETGVVLHLMP